MFAIDLIMDNGFAISRAEARRIILCGGLKINEELVIVEEDESVNDIQVSLHDKDIVKVGRKELVIKTWTNKIQS